MSFPKYEAYKDSGVEWLGAVPEHWRVSQLKHLLDIQNGSDHKSIETEDGVPVFGSGGSFAFASKHMFDGESVLLGRKGTVDKPMYLKQKFWAVDTVYWSKIRPEVSGKFAFYSATTIPFGYYSTNTALPSMTKSALGSHISPVPPLEEQQSIARFLDSEITKIDNLVASQARLIELLKEKHLAVISQAVTKGLNPLVAMKDSGVDWLGEIPAHWCVLSLRWQAKMSSGELITSDDIDIAGEFPVFGGNGLRGFANRPTHSGDYVLIGRQGALCGNINYANGQFWASEHAVVVYPQLNQNYIWLGELLRSMNLNQYSIASAQPGLSVDRIRSLRTPLPPIDEQNEIACYICREATKFDDLITTTERAIGLLKERRTALISAAVTGKIDVRGFVEQAA